MMSHKSTSFCLRSGHHTPTRLLVLLFTLSIILYFFAVSSYAADDALNPDDFDRMDIDVSKAVAYHSDFPATIDDKSKHSRNAYVLIHYEGTPRDDLYVLGTRVVIRSVQESGSKQDVVIICATNVRESTIETFKRDGAIVKMVPNIPNPYKLTQQRRRTYKSRFEFTFNKLYVWNLLEYERVIYMDADNLITRNMDELFLCGHYCATFFNPLFFHTGMMVVRPNRDKFKELLHGLLSLSLFSYDGADQGFLTAAFPGVESAPSFNPQRQLVLGQGTPSESPLMRFPMEYNLNNAFFYAKFSFDRFRQANLPMSYQHHFQQQMTSQKTLLSTSPLRGEEPVLSLTVAQQEQFDKAMMLGPQSEQDFAMPISSLDYCLGPIIKPWNWVPFIYFHTVRYWASVRLHLEESDLRQGINSPSQTMFWEAINNGVLPLVILPFIIALIARFVPGIDTVRRSVRVVFRSCGTTIPSALLCLFTLAISAAHVFNTVPLETRPELAWICVSLILILGQYNLLFSLATFLSPPMPSLVNTPAVPGGPTPLEDCGVRFTQCYGSSWSQIKNFFTTLFSVRFYSQPYQQHLLQYKPDELPLSLQLDNAAPAEISSSTIKRRGPGAHSSTHRHSSPSTNGLADNNSINDVELLNLEDSELDDFSSILNDNSSDDEKGHDNANIAFNADVTSSNIDQNTEKSAILLHCDFYDPDIMARKSSALAAEESVLQYTLLPSSITQPSRHRRDDKSEQTQQQDEFDFELENDTHFENHDLQQPNTIASHHDDFSQPTIVSSSAMQERTVQLAARKTTFTVLGHALSMRGGVYPSILYMHFFLMSLMFLWLLKLGSYPHFVVKIAWLSGFGLVLVLYSILATKKVMDMALGSIYSLGKVYL